MAWVEVWSCSYHNTTRSPYEEPFIYVLPTEADCIRSMSSQLHCDTGMKMVTDWDELKSQVDGLTGGRVKITRPFFTTFDPGEVTLTMSGC